MKPSPQFSRRSFLKSAALTTIAAPYFIPNLLSAPPSERVFHASFGAGGMARADLTSIISHKNVEFAAVTDVEPAKANDLKQKYPNLRVYADWREMLDKEKGLTSVNVSTPDHMHASMGMSAMQRGLHVYGQKPLTHDIYETRKLTEFARAKKLVTQMGIQIHSSAEYRAAVQMVQDGVIGKIKEVHTWSSKKWGDTEAKPGRIDPVPAGFNWDHWIGVCAERPFIGGGWYHPGNWRKRLDFGTGTFGDMGCHIFDPVFEALALTSPLSLRSEGPAPDQWNWAVNAKIHYVFPGTKFTEDKTVPITWYDGDERPPAEIRALIETPAAEAAAKSGKRKGGEADNQGSIIIGTQGVLHIPHVAAPKLFPIAKFKDYKLPECEQGHHWTEWAEACMKGGKPGANFDYSGPLTEAVLLGSVAVRFPKTKLEWNGAKLQFENERGANQFLRRTYRKGWEVAGL